ncbi:hypothetical protein K488DRAFT_60723, partial [Vararia minispora EC-137]
PRRVAYVASEELAKISAKLPANRGRALLVHALTSALGILRDKPADRDIDGTRPLQDPDPTAIVPRATIRVVRPSRASARDLCTFHNSAFVDRLLDIDAGRQREGDDEFGLEDDCAPFDGMPEYVLGVAGATLDAVKVLMNDEADVAICWDGGRHHAHKSRASGFCYVNDCVLALLALRRMLVPSSVSRRKARVMYVDVDLHLADGVAAAFHVPQRSGPSNILTLSLHHTAPGFFPVPLAPSSPGADGLEIETAGDPFTLGASIRAGASAHTYARVWAGVETVARAFVPDVLVLQCGADALAGDPCRVGNWCLGGVGGMGWCVARATALAPRLLLLGGGGYHSANTARAWAYLTSVVKGDALSLDTPIPDHAAFPAYAPSFTLDVPPGAARDENDDTHIDAVLRAFERAAETVREKMKGAK